MRKKYIASAKSYLPPPKVLILGDTDVVFCVKLILKNIIKFMELSLCGKATAVD